MVAVPYLAASYFAQGAFKETAEALFVLAVAVGPARDRPLAARTCRGLSTHMGTQSRHVRRGCGLPCPGWRWPAASSSPTASPGSPGRSSTVALWSLTLPEVRRALAPRALLRFLLRPATLLTIVVLVALAAAATLVGPFGFVHSFNKVAGTNTYGPVSPIEALGVWPATDYRLEAPGGAHLTGLAGAIGVLALLAGTTWWVRRRELAVPLGLGRLRRSSTSSPCRPAATTRTPRR